jgi:hypothetical protein
MKMIPIVAATPGRRVHAFKGPNAGKWGTIVSSSGNKVLIRWDAPAEREKQPLTTSTLF